MAIPREAGRITYSAEIRNLKKRLRLNEQQKAVLIGTILGDSHLAENWSKTNYRLKISQSKRQEKYVLWKYNVFKEWTLTKPKLHASTNSVRFGTISHSELTYFHDIFYRGRKKVVPDSLGKLLSSLALAVWFMDDGNVRKAGDRVYGYYLNTQSFSFSENEALADILRSRFGICSTIYRNHGKPRLYIGAKSKSMFRNLLEPYVLPSLKYKLG